MDIKVGKILECEPNPDSDVVFLDKVDIGGGEIKSISSGHQHFYTTEEMIDSLVVVVCNLKPRKIAGNISEGVILFG